MEEALEKLTEALVGIVLASPKFKEFIRAEVNAVPATEGLDILRREINSIGEDTSDVTRRLDHLDSSDIDDFSSAVREVVREMNFTVEVRS